MHATRSLAIPFLALAHSVPLAASPQAADVTVLIRGSDFGTPSTVQPSTFDGLALGADHGWAVSGTLDLGGPQLQAALFGDLTPGGIAGAQLLRTPATLGGQVQQNLLRPSLAGGRLAYIESSTSTLGPGGRGVWIDDRLVAGAGDPIGATGNTWTRFRSVAHLVNGDSYVRGQFALPQGLGVGVVRFPAQDVILATGDLVPGLPQPVGSVREFEISPGGAHWIAKAVYGSPPMEAIVVDGAIYDVGAGNLALQGGSVPVGIAGPGATFGSFARIAINDDGDVALTAFVNTLVSGGPVNIRGGRRVEPSLPAIGVGSVEAIDPRGFVATVEGVAFVGVDGIPATGRGATVDVDGDGTVDPGWTVRLPSFGEGLGISSDGTELLWTVQLRGPGIQRPIAVVRVERYGIAQPICTGRTNSTGGAAHVTAIGSSDVQVNEIALQCIELPTGSAGMFLVSSAAGFTPNPGGSVGDLCLAGSIGRYASSPFLADATGRVELDIDLLALPRPMGTVAASAGSTWYFQAWYRDSIAGAPVSNFSDAVAVGLR